jgi:hypothetical protein
MNYLNIIPHDIYTQIYKYVYNDCMKEVVSSYNDKRNNKYKDKFFQNIINDNNRICYTYLDIFNPISFGIINNYENMENDTDLLDEEIYYLSKITEYNFRKYHYNILINDLPDNFKEATCIRIKLSNIDILLGFDDLDDTIYPPLYYLFKDFLTTWLELIYYTNKLLNEYLLINNLVFNVNFFPLYKFETIIENGYVVIVPFFEEYI